MDTKDNEATITKISQVTPEVTLFLRKLGLSDYYIIKIFALVGDAAIGLTEDDPYWLLDEFQGMRFDTADKIADTMGIAKNSPFRIRAAVRHGLALYVNRGNTFVPAREFCQQISGFLDLTRDEVEDVVEDMALVGDLQLSTLAGTEVLYFYGYYRTECQVAGKIARMAENTPKPVGANISAVISKAESQSGIKLTQSQREAVEKSLGHSVSIITGGPGTGKTTIINTLIKIMEQSGLDVAVAAPTGRAAKRITQTSGKGAMTVHRLLEYYYDEEARHMAFGRNQDNPLDYGAVIIDEASMMDLMLMGALCRALRDDCRLILTGDADQLPPVGAGNVLEDLINSGYVYTSRLSEIFRQAEESGIVLNAHRINQGSYPKYGKDFLLVEADKQKDILGKITDLAAKWPSDKVQVLTPVKKGILGSASINEHLQQIFNPPRPDCPELAFGSKIYRQGDRVMQIKNNYRLEFKRKDGSTGKGIFNGETGIIAAVHTDDRKITVCYDDDRWVEYPYVQMDEIELAYAVTVHKSQGSEFPVVIMPASWFPPALATRNLLYTAVTRGQRQVIIVGTERYVNSMVDNNQTGRRNSGLRDRLAGMYENI